MFYSEAILSRRGPLARVWLAAHMERKLSKNQTLQTDIEQSVGAIIGQEVEVMALRLSGQLLLGVVRIYSRKAKYLLDDCNEALLKIKMAFRPGPVDMTEDQLAVNQNAITLQGGGLDLDVLLPDINWDMDFEDRPLQPQGQHVAKAADITLATADDMTFDFEDPGYDLDLGPSDGVGSQDFDIDLGLSFGDKDEIMSVEQGRDAMEERRFSLDSNVVGKHNKEDDLDAMSTMSRQMSEHPFAPDMDMFGGDLGGDIDLGLTFDDALEKTPAKARSQSRASSPLTEFAVTPAPELDPLSIPAETPVPSPVKIKKKPKEQKQIIDDITELADGPGAKINRGRNAGFGAPLTKDVSNILTETHFLPRSSVVMRLLEIRKDPLAHFMPTTVTPNGTYFCAAPPGIGPDLAGLFMRPVHPASAKRRIDARGSPNKKRRLKDAEDLDEIEQGRRAASVDPSVLGADAFTRESVGPGFDLGDQSGMGMGDFEIPIPDFDAAGADLDGKSALSRLSTPAPGVDLLGEGDESYADLTCPIAMFDERTQTQLQSQPQGTQGTQATENEPEAIDAEGKGYSKNTVKALGIIRKELQPDIGDVDKEKTIGFVQMSEKASRRAASSFFFELLVLATRDCIQLTQDAPFENIEVRPKEKLWERQHHGGGITSEA